MAESDGKLENKMAELAQKVGRLRSDFDGRFAELKSDVEVKHQQNRSDIHKLRTEVETLMALNTERDIRMAPYFGTDSAPGIFRELVDDVKQIKEKARQTELSAAESAGATKAIQNIAEHRDRKQNLIISLLLLVAALVGVVISWIGLHGH